MQKSGEKKTNAMEKEIYLVQSALSAKQTVERVRCILREKSIPISLIIDHAQEAASCGVKLRPTYTILAGSPAMRAPNCFCCSRPYPYYSHCALAYGKMKPARCGLLTCGWKV